MIVRFRQTARRLQASLITGRREGGKVRQEHIAALGSVPLSPSPADRIAFWSKLHPRLDALSNRIDTTQRYAILAAVHARIPMPTLDEVQAMQTEHAQEDVRFWDSLTDAAGGMAAQHKALAATVQHAIGKFEESEAEFKAKAAAAQERLERVEKGEPVAGIPPPTTRADFLKAVGMTEGQAQHGERLAAICDVNPDQADAIIKAVVNDGLRAQKREERWAVRQLHRALFPPE